MCLDLLYLSSLIDKSKLFFPTISFKNYKYNGYGMNITHLFSRLFFFYYLTNKLKQKRKKYFIYIPFYKLQTNLKRNSLFILLLFLLSLPLPPCIVQEEGPLPDLKKFRSVSWVAGTKNNSCKEKEKNATSKILFSEQKSFILLQWGT